MKKIVYRFYNNEPIFSGTEEECWQWILDQAYTMSDGRKIYRTLKIGGHTCYDVGALYIFDRQ